MGRRVSVVAVAPRPVHHDAMGDGQIWDDETSSRRPPDAPAGDPVQAPTPVWHAPAVVGNTPLREPGSAVVARQQARREAGLDADGLGYPRMQLWVILVLPAAVVAALCLVALLVSGMVIWGIAGAGAAVIAGGATGYLVRDRLRMASSERRELVADRSWHSEQPWIGALTQTPERRLVAQAQDAVIRLVGAPAWTSPAFDGHRLRLDLKAELEDIDGQAYRLAASRPGVKVPAAPAELTSAGPAETEMSGHNGAREALRRRVEALSAYADAVAALPHEPFTAAADGDHHADDDRVRRALTATVRDELATDQWTALRRELPAERPQGSS